MHSPDFGNRTADRSRSAAVVATPTACPACRSSAITTTARTPDSNTYWRCSACGEVWNASRRDAMPKVARPWR